MSLLQSMQLMMATQAGPSVFTTWNPLDCSSGITLSNGNLTTTASAGTAAPEMVRSTTNHSAGKYYFEVHVDVTGTSNFGMVGVVAGGTSLTAFVGDAGYAYYQQTGQKDHLSTLTTFGSSYVAGDVIGVAVDFSAGKIWFARNNTWQASGAPDAGANAAFTGLSGTLFAAVSTYASNGPTMTGRFKAADFTYSPPSGFSAWGA